MKFVFTAPFIALGLLAGCASSPTVPAGMKAGQFVDFACEEGKRFQVRLAADGSTVRVRHQGGYELDSMGGGVYEGAGWKLVTQGPGAAELFHNGKSAMKACKSV